MSVHGVGKGGAHKPGSAQLICEGAQCVGVGSSASLGRFMVRRSLYGYT